MKDYKLDKEEEKVLKDLESGQYGTVSESKMELAKYQEYAKATLNKTKNINIRLSEKDLRRVKAKAMDVGIPYQTLLASLIHQYVDGRFQISI